jgi:methionyl-tRNA formyltransferase
MDFRELRIVFMGTPEFAVAPLRRLVEAGCNIVAVVTTPDKPAGRGLAMHESDVKRYAMEAGLQVMQPEKLKDPAFVERFRALDADLAIVIAFRMLPEIIWSVPRMGTFNLHASLLPQYRGAAPINWAIINGEKESGVTTFFLNAEIDKGDIIGQSRVAITADDNAGTLHDKLMNAGTELVLSTVQKIAEGDIAPLSQSDDRGELKPAPKIFKDDCRVDWSKSGVEIYNFIRGLSPYPAAWTVMNDDAQTSVKIYAAHFEASPNADTAGVVATDGKTFLKVACADGYVWVDSLQVQGKRRMSTDEFLRGFRHNAGLRFV